MTRFGEVSIANTQPFSVHPNGFGVSPYLQEKLVFLGQLEVYQQAGELAYSLLGLPGLTSQIYRLSTHYGAAIADALDQAAELPGGAPAPEAVVYAQADGAMLLTDTGYKEVKLGRIFPASALQASPVAERGGELEASVYVSHLGTAADFSVKFEQQLAAHTARGEALVFISDGAIWLRQLMEKACPQATLILDVYHALEHIGQAGRTALGTGKAGDTWFEQQRNLLLESRLDDVLHNIGVLALPVAVRESVCGYLRANRDRMDYQQYRQRGLLIGSGAIESAHRTVMQKRLKRAGQRWSIQGAQHLLNLRVALRSHRWNLVRQKIEPFT